MKPSLVVLLLLLLPLSASAQRRRASADEPDPVCRHSDQICWKIRLGLAAGGIFTLKYGGPGFGAQGGVTVLVAQGIELGANVVGLYDPFHSVQGFVAAGEAILRVGRPIAPSTRLFLQLSAGAYIPEGDSNGELSPSGTVGVALEAANGGSGFYVDGGLTVLQARLLTAMPHVGVGVFF